MADAPHFNPLEHPACLQLPELLDETAWAGHTPFGMFMISALRPKILVELGTYRGVSYCAFCQAVKEVGIVTECFAVDSWEGDAHSGKLGRSVFEKLRSHHDKRYGEFSKLVRSTFDDALKLFEDKSIDLLHIDGLHTYEAVRHDFNSWRPKLSKNAVVLFHDVAVRERGFGVWRFWGELSREYPSFAFSHEHGLGVIAVGDVPTPLHFLFDSETDELERIRAFFEALGDRVKKTNELRIQKKNEPGLFRAYHVARSEGLRSLYTKARRKLKGQLRNLASPTKMKE